MRIEQRIKFLKDALRESGAKGFVVGNSGGKDCALVLYLAKQAAPDNVLGVMMPCGSVRNYTSDIRDANAVAQWLGIENIQVDLTPVREQLLKAMPAVHCPLAISNIAPRLRMTTLYALAQSRGYLVAGTGNLSEWSVGYFTKWGDGAFDVNPIADMTVKEVLNALKRLGAPQEVYTKAPSAGLYEGQTDEAELGVSYDAVEEYIKKGANAALPAEIFQRIDALNKKTAHKRDLGKRFS